MAGLLAASAAACVRPSRSQAALPIAPLKSVAPAPVGCAVTATRLTDPSYTALLTREFSQLTPEWEMKMEYILQQDGSLRFSAPDAIAAFARANHMRLFGHNLVWYTHSPAAFERLDGQPQAFGRAYDDYIRAVAGRYAGQAVGWDVVNEPIAEDGDGFRDSLWRRNLGEIDYIRRALEQAHGVAPDAVLFINDYNLESLPAKRSAFLRLAESLLRAGAPLGGLGTQCHVAADLAPGSIKGMMRDVAVLGLPIHVSELDISLNEARAPLGSRAELRERQARLAGEVGEAFAGLPPTQRFALTVWGLRDGESWLRSKAGDLLQPPDRPLLFDDAGEAKPLLGALERGLRSA